uniref:Uncharacterized protein n=1 Tax=Ciona intestinalis TaxID=7719 RepID=H2XLJ0_CIOIN
MSQYSIIDWLESPWTQNINFNICVARYFCTLLKINFCS